MIGYVKQFLVVLGASAGGFFLGAYVVLGRVAQELLVAPMWYIALKQWSWYAFGVCILCVVLWIVFDIHEHGTVDIARLISDGESE